MFIFKPLSQVSMSVLVDLVNEVFKDYVVPVKWTYESFNMDIKENSISLEDSFVVFSDEKPVGFCIISLRSRIGRIDSIGVLEEYRGTGLASQMLFRVVENLKWKDIDSIILEVVELDKRSVRFYEKHGFRSKRNLYSYLKRKNDRTLKVPYFKYEATTSDGVYELAQIAKLRLKRDPNWQRDPMTLKLSDQRYINEVILNEQGEKIGYIVWGLNEDNAFIVDVSPIAEAYKFSDIVKDVTLKLFQIKDEIIVITVPEDDPLNSALIENNYFSFIKQLEMERKLH
ncbi:MAG TPA: GNAT family N-acetyltransferase [Defluviitoga sp.]|nr:GNAT family N-acetyltransferase [Defluviitoga sp.]HOP24456.1 GNAT family N-acetyltransferase [Defluviitoga sp.]HPZ28707.1 GNAT family N-acetyltransferase [Defluviitoga sp.]HQD62709.1 GNAT family N-acetyltransferase [Defluviitoga sp.]